MREQIVEKHPVIDSFHKGINHQINNKLIGLDEALIAQNVSLKNGSLKRCMGYEDIGVTNVPQGPKKLFKHIDYGKESLLIATNNGIYEVRDKTCKKIYDGISNYQVSTVNYLSGKDDITVITNGVDRMKEYKNGKFRDVKFSEDSDKYAPNGKYLTLHKTRLWTGGVKDENSMVFYSDSSNIDLWEGSIDPSVADLVGGGMVSINTWDGGDIIGIKSLFDDVVVFKHHSVFRIFGTYPGNFQTIQVFDTVDGEILESTIAVLENMVLWTSTKGIHAFNGVNTTLISSKLGSLFKTLNLASVSRSVATIHDRRYILSIPVNGSERNNLVIEYDLDTEAFTTRTDINADCFCEVDDKLLFTNDGGAIFEYDKGHTLNGKPIHMIWQSGFNSFGEQQARKILNRVYFTARGDGEVSLTSKSERKSVNKKLPLSKEVSFFRERLRNKGRYLQFTVENTNGGYLELSQFQFMLDLDYD